MTLEINFKYIEIKTSSSLLKLTNNNYTTTFLIFRHYIHASGLKNYRDFFIQFIIFFTVEVFMPLKTEHININNVWIDYNSKLVNL